ncbi:hypothetical protein GA0115240_156416 [Streptomyces sp. DvalAA-14]|nr:hypothetical protein GA0115240_156416 [Streptomyces sp. DvalAA-14]
MQRRVYGTDHDDPDPGPRLGHEYAELVGGALDGLLLDVTGWSDSERTGGAGLMTEIGAYGPGGRAWYRPRAGDPSFWEWDADSP